MDDDEHRDRTREYEEYDDELYDGEGKGNQRSRSGKDGLRENSIDKQNQSSHRAEETDEQEVEGIRQPSFCSNKDGDSPQVKTKPNIESLSENNRHDQDETAGFDLDECLKLNSSGGKQKFLFKSEGDNKSICSEQVSCDFQIISHPSKVSIDKYCFFVSFKNRMLEK